MSTAHTRVPLWLVALLCLMAFAFQGTRGIWEPDEGRYSSAGINMHESGDWLIPTIDGEHPHLTKPPMTYWALAASFAALGHNEWAARLPSALAYIGTGLFVFGLGRRLCPRRPWLPALVWGLSFAPAIASNIVSTDPLLVLFETAAMYAFVEAWSREGADARRWFVLMWLAWGLAFMTKGPPGLLPLFAMMLYLGVHDRPRFRSMFVPAGLAAVRRRRVHVVRRRDRPATRPARLLPRLRGLRPCLHVPSMTAIRSGTGRSRSTCRCSSSARCRGRRWRWSPLAARPLPGGRSGRACASATATGCCSRTGCCCRSRYFSSRDRDCSSTCCRCSCRSRS